MKIEIPNQVEHLYKNDEKLYLLCKVRQKMILSQPEEHVRQGIIDLIVQSGVVITQIDVEVPMSYFKKGKKGRADIIIYKDINHKQVEFVIECKAKSVALTDNVFKQVLEYNKVANCDFVCITNGFDFNIFEKKGENYAPVYPNSLKDFFCKNINFDEINYDSWERTSAEQLHDAEYLKKYNDLFTGAPSYPTFRYRVDYESSKDVKQLSIRLFDLFYDLEPSNKVAKLNTATCTLVQDKGERFGKYTVFGGQGIFTEYYRYFILKDANGNNFTVNFSIYSYDYYNEETEYTHESSHRGTYLMVGYDNKDVATHSLEYKIDKHVKFSDKIEFWHDGAMTVVKRQKNALIKNYIAKHYPSLLVDDKLFLGALPPKGQLYGSQEMVIDWFSRIIDYVVLRERLKLTIRANIII